MTRHLFGLYDVFFVRHKADLDDAIEMGLFDNNL